MPYLSAEMIKKIINHFINNDYDILIPQILNKIEPLHAIYSKKILTNLENHIKSTDQYKIRLFFQKVYTSYILLENSEENQKAFLNINSPDDLCLIQNIQ